MLSLYNTNTAEYIAVNLTLQEAMMISLELLDSGITAIEVRELEQFPLNSLGN